MQTEALTPSLRRIQEATETESALWAAPIQAGHVRILVFPDARTREMALGDEHLRGFAATVPPTMLTLDEAAEL